MASDVIRSRADFFRVLDDTLRMVKDRIAKAPKFPPYELIEIQLDAMKRWSAGGRTPTDDQRAHMDVGLVAVRELEPAMNDEDDEFITNLHELNFYWDYWPDDPGVAAEFPP